jgi:hypothetical protein
VQDVNLAGVDDPNILAWAAANDRILLTHDRATMPAYAYDRLVAGQPMPGAFILSDRFPVREAIEELLLLATCSEQLEFRDCVVFLPL